MLWKNKNAKPFKLYWIAQIDAEIDEKVLNLYGINDPTDRQRILGSASKTDEETESTDDETETTDVGEVDFESESE